MSKLVVIELGEGDLQQQGFPVTLRIMEDGKPYETSITGKLPPNSQVEESYVIWRSHYRSLDSLMRLEDEDSQVTNIGDRPPNPIDECKEAGQVLIDALNSWLKSSSFSSIREKFLQKNRTDEEIKIILQTDDYLLRKLPWTQWELLAEYANAEIAFSPKNYEPPPGITHIKKKRKIKILAILGDNKNIDLEKDREILKSQLPDAKIEFLVKPKRSKIDDKLREESWDILFFAGHSESQSDFSEGLIKINDTDSLNLKDLRSTLSKAIEKGLSLAIFNSCDGLGLAAELSTMQIPQMIVMQESIPDVVAHEFLKYFLKAFARTHSLYLAVREARERLKILENGLGEDLDQQFPCASWLPVIFQNPAYKPLIWVPHKYTPKLRSLVAASLAVASLVLGVRHLGLLQPLELKAYDQMMQLRPDEKQDPRILVVEVTQRDVLDERAKDKSLGSSSLTDTTLIQLLKEISKHNPRVIGLDIYRDLPVGAKPNLDLEKLFQENKNLFAVCQVDHPKNGGGIPAASFIPKENLGFSDVLLDPDDVLRRHLLHIDTKSNSPCTAENAFSFELASQYLYTEGIEPENTPEGDVIWEKARLRNLSQNAGGYQTFPKIGSENTNSDYKNFQILLNYRNGDTAAKSDNVTNILNQNSSLLNSMEDQIVIIGVTDPSFNRPDGAVDEFQTPYGGEKMRGVYVHAQMVSQLISAALGERPLLGVWAWWGDGLWICAWSFVGGLIIWRIRDAIPVGLGISLAIVILSGSCFLLFVMGYWVPFVPSLLTLTGSSGILICYSLYKKSKINA
ncbi:MULTISPECIES: CHASE2 domain-containing protein [Calothrix]|uniref:CHASE2 domain-containing protein n=2 Tax=Calothrix TaxID=1186 RepID=A0ABR8AK77_9CYAN|nr:MULTISPECIES: CHASE2 domain-containing protein [Calothrix]MBD2200184.1 CHASE2 domain-containing protein [Calothrix parietina FACHB-288]MBD2229161.1 CHASE2 domain-containing protein [Calothrix anomala FACHB-343]